MKTTAREQETQEAEESQYAEDDYADDEDEPQDAANAEEDEEEEIVSARAAHEPHEPEELDAALATPHLHLLHSAIASARVSARAAVSQPEEDDFPVEEEEEQEQPAASQHRRPSHSRDHSLAVGVRGMGAKATRGGGVLSAAALAAHVPHEEVEEEQQPLEAVQAIDEAIHEREEETRLQRAEQQRAEEEEVEERLRQDKRKPKDSSQSRVRAASRTQPAVASAREVETEAGGRQRLSRTDPSPRVSFPPLSSGQKRKQASSVSSRASASGSVSSSSLPAFSSSTASAYDFSNRISELERLLRDEQVNRKTAEREVKRLERACLQQSRQQDELPLLVERMTAEMVREKELARRARERSLQAESEVRTLLLKCAEMERRLDSYEQGLERHRDGMKRRQGGGTTRQKEEEGRMESAVARQRKEMLQLQAEIDKQQQRLREMRTQHRSLAQPADNRPPPAWRGGGTAASSAFLKARQQRMAYQAPPVKPKQPAAQQQKKAAGTKAKAKLRDDFSMPDIAKIREEAKRSMAAAQRAQDAFRSPRKPLRTIAATAALPPPLMPKLDRHPSRIPQLKQHRADEQQTDTTAAARPHHHHQPSASLSQPQGSKLPLLTRHVSPVHTEPAYGGKMGKRQSEAEEERKEMVEDAVEQTGAAAPIVMSKAAELADDGIEEDDNYAEEAYDEDFAND